MSQSGPYQYTDDEMLQLSGIQHYVFCPRQWALIYIEQEWIENHLTAEGKALHENVDNPFLRETNGSQIITLRGIRLESKTLGFSGIADAIEIHPHQDAPVAKKDLLRSRKYSVVPIEYKRGKRKISDCDRLQVAAQAMILEEMLDVKISQGAVFYWTERHREYFEIDDDLRSEVTAASREMHSLFSTRSIPAADRQKGCRNCSMADVCLPELSNKSVSKYLKSHFDEETP